MTSRLSRRFLTAGAAATLTSCVIQPVCGCSPPPPAYLAVGSVTTAAGAPVAGAEMSARVMGTTCAESAAPVYADAGRTTAADGTYSLRFYDMRSELCVRIVAHRSPTDSAVSADTRFAEVYERGGPAPRTVNVVFP